ncbi:MAG: hypothetical protein IKJ45_02790 [Kiritimatiellae bacterium]|nr:hypothetical protein [Kiritimatiellia bacterium]
MKKCIYLAALAASVLWAVHLVRETRRLRNQVQQLEEERRRTAVEALDQGLVGISDGEKERMIGIYRDIAQAYTNCDIMAMRLAMLKVPEISDHLTWEIRPQVEKPLDMVFSDTFLRATKLLDFDTSGQFAEFLKANIEVALFLGDVYIRQKCFSMASYTETMTFFRLKQYKEKFDKEGEGEFREVAAKALEFWTACVESPHGFTRQQARWEFRVCTEYVKILKPERAMTREEAAKHAYCLVKALFKKTGYTPAWLSEYAAKEPTAP